MPLSDMGGLPNVGGPTLVDPFGRPLQGSPKLAIPSFDPRLETVFFDDFFGSIPTTSPNDGNWSKTVNQGASFDTGNGSDANSQGTWQIASTGAIANNYFALAAGNQSFTPLGAVHEWRIKTPTSLSNATNQYYIIAGMSDQRFVAGGVSNECVFSYTHTNPNGAFQIVKRLSGVLTTYPGITPVQANTWYRVRLVFDPWGTSAALYVNDIFQCAATGINPTAMAIGAGHVATTTGNSEVIKFDYFYLRQRINRL